MLAAVPAPGLGHGPQPVAPLVALAVAPALLGRDRGHAGQGVRSRVPGDPGAKPSAPGGFPPHGVSADWLLLAGLIERLGGSAPRDLSAIRAALAGAHPSYKLPEGRIRRVGRLALPLA